MTVQQEKSKNQQTLLPAGNRFPADKADRSECFFIISDLEKICKCPKLLSARFYGLRKNLNQDKTLFVACDNAHITAVK